MPTVFLHCYFDDCVINVVCFGISSPLPLRLQTVQAPGFYAIPHYILIFCDTPPPSP